MPHRQPPPDGLLRLRPPTVTVAHAEKPLRRAVAMAYRTAREAKRADALLDLGDTDGQRVWKAILRAVQEAVQELTRTARKLDEQLN